MQPKDRYTYENAGFSAFMLRSRKSNPGAQTVRGGISQGSGKPIAFDRLQIQGALGDKVTIGRLILAGDLGRIIVMDRAKLNEVGWVGDLLEG